MTEGKMTRVISSLWGKLEEKRDGRKLVKYKNWCAQVDKKCSAVMAALKILETAGIFYLNLCTAYANSFYLSPVQ